MSQTSSSIFNSLSRPKSSGLVEGSLASDIFSGPNGMYPSLSGISAIGPMMSAISSAIAAKSVSTWDSLPPWMGLLSFGRRFIRASHLTCFQAQGLMITGNMRSPSLSLRSSRLGISLLRMNLEVRKSAETSRTATQALAIASSIFWYQSAPAPMRRSSHRSRRPSCCSTPKWVTRRSFQASSL